MRVGRNQGGEVCTYHGIMGKKGKKSKSKKQHAIKYTNETDPILIADAKLMPKKIEDDILFRPHPPQPDCPICCIPLPLLPVSM